MLGRLEQGQDELERRLEAIAQAHTATMQNMAAEIKELRADIQEIVTSIKFAGKIAGFLLGFSTFCWVIIQIAVLFHGGR